MLPERLIDVRAMGPWNVMIVDDDAIMVMLAEVTLRRLGHRAAGFTSAQSAIASFASGPTAYDIVICDVQLEEVSGFDVVRRLRELDARVPLLMTSGAVGVRERAEAQAAGALDLMLKNDVMTDLGATLERFLAGEAGGAGPEGGASRR